MTWLKALDWPADVQRLCERYGHVNVWNTIEQEFGFPATWGLTGSQLIKTEALLDGGQ